MTIDIGPRFYSAITTHCSCQLPQGLGHVHVFGFCMVTV